MQNRTSKTKQAIYNRHLKRLIQRIFGDPKEASTSQLLGAYEAVEEQRAALETQLAERMVAKAEARERRSKEALKG